MAGCDPAASAGSNLPRAATGCPERPNGVMGDFFNRLGGL